MGWPSVNAKAIGIARLTGYDGLGLHAELLAKIGRIEIFSPAQDLALCIEIVDGAEGVRDAHPMHREIVQAFGHHRSSGGEQPDDSALHEGRELELTFNFSADRLSTLSDLPGHTPVPYTFSNEL